MVPCDRRIRLVNGPPRLPSERPVEILHDQEVDLTFPANVEERADVRVVQGGDRAGLTLEPLLQIRITRDMRGQHLDGDGAVQAGVGGLVDLPHAPFANAGGDVVRAEAVTDV